MLVLSDTVSWHIEEERICACWAPSRDPVSALLSTTMDIFIETLTGTVYELRVSPFETILSVKAKLQRLEDIAIPAQHLVYRSLELEDDCYLHDYGITHGSTLRLVVAMRGGPINTSRRTLPPLVDDEALREMAEYVDSNPEEFWESLPPPRSSRGKQVTLLVFREGDQLNFFRVFDRGDGTLTPLSESRASSRCSSEYSTHDESRPGTNGAVNLARITERLTENEAMLAKVNELRLQMSKLMAKKHRVKPKPPPGKSDSRRSKQKRKVGISSRQCSDLGGYLGGSQTTLISQASELSDMSSSVLPPLPLGGSPPLSVPPSANGRKLKSLPRNITPAATATLHGTETPSVISCSRLSSRSIQSVETRRTAVSKDKSLPLCVPAGKKGKKGIIRKVNTDSKPGSRHHQIAGITTHLPPLHVPPAFTSLVQQKKTIKPARPRCSVCRKKTGLATSFTCRCGGTFCSIHRYAEEHKCTFDYKGTGRQLLQQSNPVVEAPKLPKI